MAKAKYQILKTPDATKVRSLQINQPSTNNDIMLGNNITHIKENFKLLNEFAAEVKNNLVANVDYGFAYSGTDKPSLLKPGMEKIIILFGLTPEINIIEKERNDEKKYVGYTIEAFLKTKDGKTVSVGMGHCNSKEKAKLNADYYRNINDCLKIAIKRAKMDATLGLGALSGIFTQDMEKGGDNKLIKPDNTSKFDRLKLYQFTYKTAVEGKATDKQKDIIKKILFPLMFEKFNEKSKDLKITTATFISDNKITNAHLDTLKEIFINVLANYEGEL